MLRQQLDRRVAGADFDQNLSPRLVARLADLYPDSNHIYLLGLDRVPDQDGRQYARREGFLLVTKDADFAVSYSCRATRQPVVTVPPAPDPWFRRHPTR